MALSEFKLRQKESKAFKKIVAKQTLQARRKAFADEALVQAKKKGRELAVAKAQKGSFGEQVRRVSKKTGKAIVKKVLAPPKKSGKKSYPKKIMVDRSPKNLSSPIGFEGF